FFILFRLFAFIFSGIAHRARSRHLAEQTTAGWLGNGPIRSPRVVHFLGYPQAVWKTGVSNRGLSLVSNPDRLQWAIDLSGGLTYEKNSDGFIGCCFIGWRHGLSTRLGLFSATWRRAY